MPLVSVAKVISAMITVWKTDDIIAPFRMLCTRK